MARLTAALAQLPGAEIVRHANARSPLGQLVLAHMPDVVLVGDLTRPVLAVQVAAQVREVAPDARTVVLASDPRATWLAQALRAGASAVIPGDVDAATLVTVLQDVLDRSGAAPVMAA
jgi:DNA-binding NarL/FixJ family response regulator